MSDHTPGPWKIKSNGNGLTPSIVTDDEFAATWEIARIKDVPAGAYKANALLIHASPDLLAVVEKLASTQANDFNTEAEHWEFIAQLRIQAREAFAKAKGK